MHKSGYFRVTFYTDPVRERRKALLDQIRAQEQRVLELARAVAFYAFFDAVMIGEEVGSKVGMLDFFERQDAWACLGAFLLTSMFCAWRLDRQWLAHLRALAEKNADK